MEAEASGLTGDRSVGDTRRMRKKRPSRPLVALFVLFACLLASGSALALAAHSRATSRRSEAPDLEVPESEGAATGPGAGDVEVKADRTADSNTFALPDGTMETRLYGEPVNYQGPKGAWMPITEGFSEAGQSLGDRSHPFEVHLPQRLGDAPVRVGSPDREISFELLGPETDRSEVAADGTASYESPATGTTFEYATLANGVKETIELAGSSSKSTVDFRMNTAAGIIPELTQAGSIAFRSAAGKEVAEMPAPVVGDAGGIIDEPELASYSLTPVEPGEWDLAVDVDRSRLEKLDHAWPVTIDPTVIFAEGKLAESCYISTQPFYGEEYSLCNFAFPTSVSTWPGESKEFFSPPGSSRALFGFAPGGLPIPANAEITGASVNLYSPEAAKGTVGVELDPVTTNWTSAATWKRARNPYIYWNTPGGDFTTGASEVSIAERGLAPGWWNFTKGLKPVVEGWIHGTPDYGFIVKQKREEPWIGGLEEVKFDTNGATNPSLRPYMRITYMVPAPGSSKVTSPTEGTRTARRLKLQAKWTEAGVTGVTFQARVGKGKGQFEDLPVGLVHEAGGEAVKAWPVAVSGVHETEALYLDAAHVSPSLRKEGGPIYIRALFEGPEGVSGFSEPVEAVVNRIVGSAHDATAEVGPGLLDLETGNLALSRTDVSIPSFNSSLTFTRSYNSRAPKPVTETEKAEPPSVLGPGWKSGMQVEEEGGSEWRNVHMVVESGSYEEEVGEQCHLHYVEEEGEVVEEVEECEPQIIQVPYRYAYAVVMGTEGAELPFEEGPGETFITPPELTGWKLVKSGAAFVLTDPYSDITTFEKIAGESEEAAKKQEYLPVSINQPGGAGGNTSRFVWRFKAGEKQLIKLIAPSAPGLSCSEVTSTAPTGCHALSFTYEPVGSTGERLTAITFLAPGNGGSWEVAHYEYNAEGRLVAEWDPRISPALKERYAYEANGQLKEQTPPGQKPWKLEYGTVDEEIGTGRLVGVKRASLLTSPTEAKTTIAYGVPISGAGSPYPLNGTETAKWGQRDLPVEATAIFPASEVPSSNPPSAYTQATIYYMDSEGFNVNTATEKGAGSGNPSIATTEPDEYGNIVRELTPSNRQAVLSTATAEQACESQLLETKRVYNEEGAQMVEEWGPMHPVRIAETGLNAEARLHTTVQYDSGWPGTGLKPHLPTRETSGASNIRPKVCKPTGEEPWATDKDQRVVETEYDWTLRKPTKTIVDPGTGHLNIASVTTYNTSTGLPTQVRQPSNPAGGGAGTTVTYYYEKSSSTPGCSSETYSGLTCEVAPAAQPGTAGLAKVVVKKFLTYNALGEPMEVLETPGGGGSEKPEEGAEKTRTTHITYDAAGRPLTLKTEGGGLMIPKSETIYSTTMGMAEVQQFTCAGTECSGTSGNKEAAKVSYNEIGQPTEYFDASGAKTKFSYDIDGRQATVADEKGTQTFNYNGPTGLLTSLEVSEVGTFTAAYDLDGNLVERGLPNGLTAKTTYNAVGEPTKLTYTKTSSCGESCTWYEESLERSTEGRILASKSSLVGDRYVYDKSGRLTESQETPTGGQCTSRSYTFDADSNRLSKTVRGPGVGGICPATGGTVQEYKYDAADRLLGPTYDPWGRITSLPAEFAGGKALATTYFTNNMVATQAQNGVTNTFQLDATGRQRQREQAGGVAGIEIFHYDGPDDSPSWMSLGSTWSRNVPGIGGELAAVQESSGTTTFKVADLHGDIVASASSSPTVSKLLATYRFSEFGEPLAGGSGRFGWLGGKQRRTELASGVVQMGARSYVPTLGRFLTPDPIPGGSANAYDYANQDPVNGSDLEGTCAKRACAASKVRRKRAALRVAVRQVRTVVRKARHEAIEKVVKHLNPFLSISPGALGIHLPWEKQVNEVVQTGQGIVSTAVSTACKEHGAISDTGAAIAGGGVLFGPTAEVKAAVAAVGVAISGLGGALGLLHRFGGC